jgi:hypothetical protein
LLINKQAHARNIGKDNLHRSQISAASLPGAVILSALGDCVGRGDQDAAAS